MAALSLCQLFICDTVHFPLNLQVPCCKSFTCFRHPFTSSLPTVHPPASAIQASHVVCDLVCGGRLQQCEFLRPQSCKEGRSGSAVRKPPRIVGCVHTVMRSLSSCWSFSNCWCIGVCQLVSVTIPNPCAQWSQAFQQCWVFLVEVVCLVCNRSVFLWCDVLG